MALSGSNFFLTAGTPQDMRLGRGLVLSQAIRAAKLLTGGEGLPTPEAPAVADVLKALCRRQLRLRLRLQLWFWLLS